MHTIFNTKDNDEDTLEKDAKDCDLDADELLVIIDE
jgi:hypothetical protein